jgi:squalene cyclase
LLSLRAQNGLWRDFFGTPNAGFSDEWVTAYVADALASLSLRRARAAAHTALGVLLQRREGVAGWGYHAVLPPDGDSTTWVLRLARSLAAPDNERLSAARELINSLTVPEGGVTSYTPRAAATVARIIGIGGSYAGWSATAHACITGPAAALRLSPALTEYLRASQHEDGSWSSYWWEDREYATAWAVAALASSGADRDAVEHAVAWSASRVGPDGAVSSIADGNPSPFATALALYAIRMGGSNRDRQRWVAAAERAQAWLLDHQLDNGCWEPSARMQVPFAFVRDRTESADLILRYIRDSGAFTTATVLASLSPALSP